MHKFTDSNIFCRDVFSFNILFYKVHALSFLTVVPGHCFHGIPTGLIRYEDTRTTNVPKQYDLCYLEGTLPIIYIIGAMFSFTSISMNIDILTQVEWAFLSWYLRQDIFGI